VPAVWQYSAHTYTKVWRNEDTLFAYCLSNPPYSYELPYAAALNFIEVGQLHKGKLLLDESLHLAPEYMHAINNLAVVYMRMNQPEKALPIFISLTKKKPNFPRYHYNLARTALTLGDFKLAAESINRCLQLKADYPGAMELFEEAKRGIDQ
jgi:tetratricopeptide (TPR) repeat protein